MHTYRPYTYTHIGLHTNLQHTHIYIYIGTYIWSETEQELPIVHCMGFIRFLELTDYLECQTLLQLIIIIYIYRCVGACMCACIQGCTHVCIFLCNVCRPMYAYVYLYAAQYHSLSSIGLQNIIFQDYMHIITCYKILCNIFQKSKI